MPTNLHRRGGTIWHFKFRRHGLDFEGSTFTADLDEAQRRLEARREEIIGREFGAYPTRTIYDAIERFQRERYHHLRPRSQRRYDAAIKALLSALGALSVRRLSSAHLARFEDRRRAEGLCSSSIRRDLAVLSAVYSSAQVWEWCESNIVAAYLKARRRTGLTDGEPRQRVLSEEEEALILKHCRPEAVAALVLCLDAGLRREEVLSLRWFDVDLVRGEIRIRGENAKSGRERIIPLFPRVRAALERLPRCNGCPHVFFSRYKRRYAPESNVFNTALAAAVQLAGIERGAPILDVRLHDLRRTCGHRLIAKHGWQMHEVQKFLGHSSIQVTERHYAVVGADEVRAAMARTLRAIGHTPLQASPD